MRTMQLANKQIGRRSSRSSRGDLLVSSAVKAKSARAICCSKTLVAKPNNIDAVQQLCKQITEFSEQQMSNRSNGIQEFTCAVDGWDSNVFHFWERYESNAAMGRYNTKPEVVKFMEDVSELLEKPVGMALYEYRNGQLGGVAMQGGPKGEGGLDDATGASGAAGGASYKQTSRAAQLTSLKDDDLAPNNSSTVQKAATAADEDAQPPLLALVGNPAAIIAVLSGAVTVLAFATLKLAGH